ncbi:hypothetical protein ES332_A02G016800v1 [Gossypium tomentosum]|uniref:Reverse transcriptase zinc-binding domain-containing protein n=1 Tax=Gossypium tomentosum TaxID=34277 RepID=A0A5D2RBV7_GOSTO|nr:hypothetical protein ES332_A02G016800v1 [Gossypium tomentosum]
MAKISWNIVCKPKVMGGAGVVNLGIKNRALLAKWSWRFAIEKEAMWRKVILAKYESKVQRWRFKTTHPKDMSTVWRGIVENAKDAVVSKWVGMDSFYWRIGNGRATLFWMDIWCDNQPLKHDFPRLFCLARQKESLVADFLRIFGFYRDDWNELFTRSLLGKEEVMLSELVERDKLCWANYRNGDFSVKKCSELLIMDGGKLKMLAINRIPTKEFLVKRGVNLQNISISCPWCKRDPESASHLFFKGKFIESFWIKIFNCWRISFWLIPIPAACWTVWLARNGLVFERRRMALLWIRSVYDEVMLQENFWWMCLNRCRIDSIKSKLAASIWRRPPHGWLKFNVCGIAKEDRAGCGGVLRDKEGVARALFSGSAINDSLYIELGSMMVFSWCANKAMRLWSLQAIFAVIESDMFKVENVVFSMADKKGNEMASSLAIAGVLNKPVLVYGVLNIGGLALDNVREL